MLGIKYRRRSEKEWTGPIRVTGPSFTVGRSLGSSLVIDEPTLSRTHLEIVEREGKFYAIGRSQTNPLRYKGNVQVEIPIEHRSRVQMGAVELEFVLETGCEKTELVVPYSPITGRSPHPMPELNRAIAEGFLGALLVTLTMTTVFLVDIVEEPLSFLYLVFGVLFTMHSITLAFAIYSKIHSRYYQYLPILRVVTFAACFVNLYNFLDPLFSFNLPRLLWVFIDEGVGFVFFLTVGSAILSIIFLDTPRKRILTYLFSFLICVYIVFFGIHWVERKNGGTPEINQALSVPLVLPSTAPGDLEPFYKNLEVSQRGTEKLRLKQLEKIKKRGKKETPPLPQEEDSEDPLEPPVEPEEG